MTQKITFVTGNPHKAQQVGNWLGLDILHRKIDLAEIQTLDVQELVEHKVRQAYNVVQAPVLVEDASLYFTALGRLPGPYIKWFMDELGPEGLAKILHGHTDRSAYAICCYALYNGGDDIQFFKGTMRGTIAHEPKGTGGFGFDAVFINNGYNHTRAQMSSADYAATSYRNKALQKLKEHIQHG